MLIRGQCRCGNISLRFDCEPGPAGLEARACSCSFCMEHAGVWTSSPTASLSVVVRERTQTSIHSFATRTAEFHVCTACGDVPVVTSRIAGRTYAVVNVHAFADADPALFRPSSTTTFDGENESERLARRARNWIADVTFSS